LIVSTVGAVLVLAAATGAAGKAPPTGIELCGRDGCTTIAGADAERVVISLYGSRSAPAAPAPSFLLRWQWNASERKAWWVPRSGVVRGLDGGWMSLDIPAEAVLKWAADGLEPFPAPTLTRVVVGRRVAENPQSYLGLLRAGKLAASFDGARGFVDVRLTSLEPSPWTNGSAWVMVSKARNFVWRDVWVYRVPQTLAERARSGLSLTPFSRASR
jgi:hypothetical protein